MSFECSILEASKNMSKHNLKMRTGFWFQMYQTIKAYSEQSSIQGIKYIFQSGQSLAARIFWVNVVIGMIVLSGYLSFQVTFKFNFNNIAIKILDFSQKQRLLLNGKLLQFLQLSPQHLILCKRSLFQQLQFVARV